MRLRHRWIILPLFIAAILQSACLAIDGLQQREEISKTFDLKSGGSVTVRNVNGLVEVESWDQEKVQVLAVKTARGYDQREAESNLKRLEVTFNQSGNDLTIETHYPSLWHFGGGVEYSLHVPRKFNLTLHTTNGRIHASDVQGQIYLQTTNGIITAENLSGSLQAKTTNGKISASFTRFTGGDIRLTTTNGIIQLSLPDDTDADVSARTTNGTVRSDFPLTTQGGWVRHNLEGRIGKGGSTIELRTTNGGISILRLSNRSV